MSVEDHTVSFSLEINIDKSERDVRRFLTLLMRVASMLRRFIGDENFDKLIAKAQSVIMWLNQVRLAALAAQAAMGPFGVALAVVSGVGVALSGADMIETLSEVY